MPYNSETGQYERRVTTILDETPDGDTVNSAVAVKIDAAVDDGPTDLNHHKVQGGHYPATGTATSSRYLHQSPAGIVSWRDGVPADQAAQVDASNVTDGAAWRTAIGAEAAGAAVTEVATHNADASAHGLDSKVWTVTQGGTGASTTEDARAALDVYSKGAVDAALGGIRTGTAHAPQSIIKAALGPRPDGWTAADCDAPVASLSYSGNVVTVEAGLQVAYADGGSVQLSEALAAPHVVDLSAAADGTHHVYADIAEDGTFSGFGHTDMVPEVGVERGRIGTQDDVTSVTADPATYSGDPNTLVNGSLSGYVQWTTPAITVNFLGVGGRLQEFSIFAPRVQNILPKTWEVDGLSGGIWTKIGDGVTASVDDWTSDRYISTTITDSTTVYEQFRLRTTSSWGSGMIFTDVKFSALADPADLYNPTTVTHYDSSDVPIRRVYLGWVEKVSGAITDVHCYSLGNSTITPIANGVDLLPATVYVEDLGFLMANGSCRVEIYAAPHWFEAPEMYYQTSGHGVFGRVLTTTTWRGKTASYLGANPDTGTAITQAKARLVIQRGY